MQFIRKWWRDATTSAPPTRPTPKGITEINDSLYQLYSPAEGAPEVDIIFFHGLQVSDYTDAYWTTWSSDGEKIWPQTLLSTVFPTARILSVSYDSCARLSANTGRMDIDNIGEALLRDIIESEDADVGKIRPVLLVGHSLGGLVIKKLLMVAYERMNRYDPQVHANKIEAIKSFLENVKGIFYYATPHGGSALADIVAKIPGASPVLILLKSFSAETEQLNQEFAEWRAIHKIRAYTLYESQATPAWGVNAVIVTEASARRDSDQFYPAKANHISICKPSHLTSSTFVRLKEFMRETIREVRNVNPPTLPEERVLEQTLDDDMT